MPAKEETLVAFEIGTYICPISKKRVALEAHHPISEIAWPMVIEKCRACGQNHLLEYRDLRHPPVFGYE